MEADSLIDVDDTEVARNCKALEEDQGLCGKLGAELGTGRLRLFLDDHFHRDKAAEKQAFSRKC